jgi:hypothetical protein
VCPELVRSLDENAKANVLPSSLQPMCRFFESFMMPGLPWDTKYSGCPCRGEHRVPLQTRSKTRSDGHTDDETVRVYLEEIMGLQGMIRKSTIAGIKEMQHHQTVWRL